MIKHRVTSNKMAALAARVLQMDNAELAKLDAADIRRLAASVLAQSEPDDEGGSGDGHP